MKQCLPNHPADMVTTNRAQLAAAIAAVPIDCDTVIEAISKDGRVLCRYAFPHGGKRTRNPKYHEAHVKQLARNVMKTPANIWR